MERGSAHHGPRIDDELAHESEALLHGSVVPGHDREDLEPEAPTEDEDLAVVEPGGTEAGPEVPRHADVIARSELARWLLPSAFPARGTTLAEVARKQDAPDEIVQSLAALPERQVYATVGELWSALGGPEEHRPVPAPHAAPVEVVTDAASKVASTSEPTTRAQPEGLPAVGEAVMHVVMIPVRIASSAVHTVGHIIGSVLPHSEEDS